MLDGFVYAVGKGLVPADNKSLLIHLDIELLIRVQAQIVVLHAKPQSFFYIFSRLLRHHVEMSRRLAAIGVLFVGRGISGITGLVLLIIFKSLISLCFITCLIRISLNLKNDPEEPTP